MQHCLVGLLRPLRSILLESKLTQKMVMMCSGPRYDAVVLSAYNLSDFSMMMNSPVGGVRRTDYLFSEKYLQ
jgi:hypothetical protein